ncbi:hypothetical protein O181_016674 [Austropuccinia psidii MF-1]|uniref:non-specific serine/threonine protein kinase n=1 Tax=Austropuccinia psidii MF-1 TaxID=1389203 RepID=A0A9Q3C4D0_9BASI|nr:hypothetical protein [Austropuccinia psidii MF-1]
MSIEELSQTFQDSISSFINCFCQPKATLKLNGRNFKIVKLLGEGGFSYVYLTQDLSSGRLFALKKIRCPLGSDSVKEALKEVEAYRRFRHPNIIRCLDSCVVQDKDGDGKVVYLFLPYYGRGNLQDLVNSHTDISPIPEQDILTYFLGTAKAVAAMHRYIPKKGTLADSYPPNTSQLESETATINGRFDRKGKGRQSVMEEEEDDNFEGIKTEEERQEAPLMGKMAFNAVAREEAPTPDETGPSQSIQEGDNTLGEIEPWAHRDLKPANVMISDEGEPILMDFGSAVKAIIEIPNRSVALQQQDLAAEHSSMPYRAPELFDVKTGEPLTEAVDIWSLGCVLFCLAYGHSPFETIDTVEQGGSMALAVMNGSWKFPNQDSRGYSEGFKNLIKQMLVVDPKLRPQIEEIIQSVEALLNELGS